MPSAETLTADATIPQAAGKPSRTQGVILLLFVAINTALFAASTPGATCTQGGDSARYLDSARYILQWLGLPHPGPALPPFSFDVPLYPALLAALDALLPWKAMLAALVVVQCAMLYATGLVVRDMARHFVPTLATVAQCLLVFNPNSLITAHLMQTDTLFTLLFTLSLAALFRFGETKRTGTALWTGAWMGLAALARPIALYAIPLLVPALALLSLSRFGPKPGRAVRAGLLAALLGTLLVAPWFARNAACFGKAFYTTNAGDYLHDQYVYLYRLARGVSRPEAEAQARRIEDEYLRTQGVEDPGDRDPHRHSELFLAALKGEFLSFSAADHAKALLHSWALLYFTGGASNYVNYLGFQGKSEVLSFINEPWQGMEHALANFLRDLGGGYLWLFAVCTAVAFGLRVLDAAGVVATLRDHRRGHTLVLLCVLLLCMALYIYQGQSRYRIPLEPALALLSAAGLEWLPIRRRTRRGDVA